MSNLHISNSKLRLATATLAALTVIAPAVYFLRGDKSQEATPHLQTFHKLLKAYTTLRPAALGANASKDFSHTVLPLSLNLPPRGLDNFQQHAVMIFSLFEDFKMEPHGEVHFSKETDTVIAHCKMGGKVNAKSDMGEKLVDGGITDWWTECVLFVKMSPDGTKVVELREFVNSAKAEELQRRLSGVLSK
ncbi:hypothetical protein PMIN06_012154 [Paraphaeosphaeria minitans]|uniref:Uncharacterized protein n=1 Tax=Paraphaeosphaeria minitans TaxID=565426 RepID=A0A9P6GFT5_9PLEO|nr:hypothetical protein PMIN01_07289 [Paraphaeosphaeria minitans]